MATFGSFIVTDYSIENGVWKIHFVNLAPTGTPDQPLFNDYYCEFNLDELTETMNQNTLRTMLTERLGWTLNQTHDALSLAVANKMTIVLA